jgi:uncharacterized protein (DUF433 family)/DNA-binding transcriptional MerR regulator
VRSFLSAYEAQRAAALAGVPERTLYHWAHIDVLPPSVSAEKGHMRWSYSDLLTARLVYWLRHRKGNDDEFAPTSMRRVRELLSSVEQLGDRIRNDTVLVQVDRAGRIILTIHGETFEPLGLGHLQGMINARIKLIEALEGAPNLWRPRDRVRIIPGTLSGQPHIAGKRVPTELIKDLADQGFPHAMIRRAYPTVGDEDIRDAISLEEELQPAA